MTSAFTKDAKADISPFGPMNGQSECQKYQLEIQFIFGIANCIFSTKKVLLKTVFRFNRNLNIFYCPDFTTML
ncbi:hypothetical protein COJ96_11580 [Bacillus sp. AFS073361]|nr:hypothetical protein COJ96_11580 [Bacillus sp. AFS073361]